MLLSELEKQRNELLNCAEKISISLGEKFFSECIFQQEDILEEMIKDFCNIEDVICINEIRDYQNETVRLCLEYQEERKKRGKK